MYKLYAFLMRYNLRYIWFHSCLRPSIHAGSHGPLQYALQYALQTPLHVALQKSLHLALQVPLHSALHFVTGFIEVLSRLKIHSFSI